MTIHSLRTKEDLASYVKLLERKIDHLLNLSRLSYDEEEKSFLLTKADYYAIRLVPARKRLYTMSTLEAG